jgi:hypothetical protein
LSGWSPHREVDRDAAAAEVDQRDQRRGGMKPKERWLMSGRAVEALKAPVGSIRRLRVIVRI